MKILVITLDGLGDRPAPVLGGKTAVEAAHTPNLDALAKRGLNGLFTSVAPGVPAGTPTAHSLMFGYPLEEIPGRAVFHAVARDVIPKEGEVVSLTRYAAVEPGPEGLRLLERRMSAPEEDSRALAAAIRTYSHDGVDLELVYTGDTEGILILRGEVDDAVTDCDPMGSELPVIKAQPMDSARDPTRARKTAEAINAYLRWAHGVLRDHPVNRKRVDQGELPMNFMLAKWAGKRQNLPSFEGRWGLRAISLTSEEILIGVMHELGVETWTDEDHDIERDMVQRLTKAKALLDEGYDFVHVHTKEPDAIAHYGDPEKKKLAIDALDRGMQYLMDELLPREDLVMCVTSDHSTPSQVAGPLTPGKFHDQHAGEPVPITIVGRNALRDGVSAFSERAGGQGSLGLVRGADLMPILLSQAERTNVIGWRPTPQDIMHRPSKVEPFEA